MNGRLVNGRYRLLSMIGSGGMGHVWLAEDEVLGRRVALKELVLAPNGEHLSVRHQRVRREARAAARIRHSGIVEIYDMFVEDGLSWIVMAYVKGRSLQDLIEHGPLGERRIAEIGRRVLAALTAAHRADVLHRDVKPANILVAEGGEVFLVDFGIAHIVGESRLTSQNAFAGTLEYMAPERINGLPPGPPADLWSLGVTLFHALEGHSPFFRGNVPATMKAITFDDPPRPTREGALSGAIVRLLRKDPGRRLDARGLEGILRSIVTDPPPSPSPHRPRPAPSSPTPDQSASPRRPRPAPSPPAPDQSASPRRPRPASSPPPPDQSASPRRPRPASFLPPSDHSASPRRSGPAPSSPAPDQSASPRRPRPASSPPPPDRSASPRRSGPAPSAEPGPVSSPFPSGAAGRARERPVDLGGLDPAEAGRVVSAMAAPPAARLLARLPAEVVQRVLVRMEPEAVGAILLEVSAERAASFLDAIPARTVGAALNAMAARRGETAAVLRAMGATRAGQALNHIDPGQGGALLGAIPPGEVAKILACTAARTAAGIVRVLAAAPLAIRLIETMPTKRACSVLDHVPPVLVAQLLEASSDGRADRLLNGLDDAVRAQVLRHTRAPEHPPGRERRSREGRSWPGSPERGRK
ncbi:serine/threonine-protein kinase [Streptosporangium sp. NPDC002524]|uniref:serine/threonine-protein kinase n=1 Tax=Streptosporangium sp. NPDC002524 TaxID=3154537 RepID=UPI00332D2D65